MRRQADDFGEPTSVAAGSSTTTERRLVLLVTNVMTGGGVVEFDLPPLGEFTLGRSPTAEVRIDAPSVSRTHALFHSSGDLLTIRDLDSTNGTFVNGQRLGGEPVEIKADDALRFGEVVGQLRLSRSSRMLSRRVVPPADFDTRIDEEAERCVRYERSFAVVVIETPENDDATFSRSKQTVISNLRAIDIGTVRSANRIEIMVCECAKEGALVIAERIMTALRSRDVAVKMGIAAYPGDVPSARSLLIAATLAMRNVASGEIGQAHAGARMIRIGGREIVVAEPAIVRLFSTIERVANATLPVLVHGETGSGKEIVAETIHQWGPRAAHPLVKLNCAAVPESLLESELFGHEKGAFSGADRAKPGLFEEADGGTIFLDEIGDMAWPLQAKLLRFLEDQRVRRVGATRDRQVDVRIVAATHRDLVRAVAEARFREDLFYRLSAVVLRLPPLRERAREIPLLAEKFVADACEQAKRDTLTIGADAMARLVDYAWPGNIRELRNVMSAAVMMCDSRAIEPHHLPPQLASASNARPSRPEGTSAADSLPAASLEEELRAIERERILQALEVCSGNQTKAAEYLRMPRRTLVSKLAGLGIDRPRKRE